MNEKRGVLEVRKLRRRVVVRNGVIAIHRLPNGKIIAIWVVKQPVLT
jgi:hypothetical protein